MLKKYLSIYIASAGCTGRSTEYFRNKQTRKILGLTLFFVLSFSFCFICTGEVDYSDGGGLDGKSEPLFSFIQVTDTQYCQLFEVNSIIDFILNNKTQYNVQYVVHTGDIAWQWDNITSWNIMNASFSRLNGQVPFGWLTGNHDFDNRTKYIGVQYYAFNASNWNVTSSLHQDRDTAQYIAVENKEFLFINIEFYSDSQVFYWFDSLYNQYPNAIVILSTHSYLNPDNRNYTNDTINPMFLNDYPRVKLVLSGHINYAYNKQVNGREEIVFDRQLRAENPNEADYFRIYSVFGDDHIEVSTYSNLRNSFLMDASNHFNFTFRTISTQPTPLAPPIFSDAWITSSVTGKSISFSVLWRDHPNLFGGGYLFSTNITGQWENSTWVPFSLDSGWGNATFQINNKVGTIGVREFANNSFNLWRDSGIFTIKSDIINSVIIPSSTPTLIVIPKPVLSSTLTSDPTLPFLSDNDYDFLNFALILLILLSILFMIFYSYKKKFENKKC